ncbi:MAG TPA: response regulator [Polyangiales bacterium]
MVIEDDEAIRETLALVLKACNFGAELVADAEHALASLKANWPDVMLLDLTLADTTGEEVHRRIVKSFDRSPPTVVISAARDGASRAKAIPGTCYLGKPYTMEQLSEVIRAAAHGAPQR